MTEHDYSKRVMQCLKRAELTRIRVETGGTSSGFPDIYVAGGGMNSFIELKSHPEKYTDEVLEDASLEGPGQAAFGRRFCLDSLVKKEGYHVLRHSFLLCSCKDGSVLFLEGADGKEAVLSWTGYEGKLSPLGLVAGLVGAYVTVMPTKDCEGKRKSDVVEGAARLYEEATGVKIPVDVSSCWGVKVEDMEGAKEVESMVRRASVRHVLGEYGGGTGIEVY